MKDLDFDELDRAVNSVIGGPKVVDPAKPAAEVPVNSSPAASEVTPPAQPLAAKRSSGRFMDVVHPSSDMRSTSVPPRPSLTNKEPAPAPITPDEPKTENSAWPDPLDFHGFKMDDAPAKPAETSEKSETASSDDKEPLVSPFLSDTKVEKRPLGAFSDASKSDKDESTASKLDTPLPAELQNDLLSIEASDSVADDTSADQLSPPEEETTPDPAPVFTPSLVTTDSEATVPSIVQQYKEQPSSVDQPTGAIFDTESYHKPLAHNASKKSGWLVVVWILALIIVGAGAGAAVFYFVLPLL